MFSVYLDDFNTVFCRYDLGSVVAIENILNCFDVVLGQYSPIVQIISPFLLFVNRFCEFYVFMKC